MDTGLEFSPSREIRIIPKEPTARLFWAINHYLPTGYEIGTGAARRRGDHGWALTIPRPDKRTQGGKDYRALAQALWADNIPEHELIQVGRVKDTELWELWVADADMLPMAEALEFAPGPLGWGSGKAEVIDRYEWRREE